MHTDKIEREELIMAGLTGHNHRDTMRIRHHEHQEVALDKIRDLRNRIERSTSEDVVSELDAILKELDDKLS